MIHTYNQHEVTQKTLSSVIDQIGHFQIKIRKENTQAHLF